MSPKHVAVQRLHQQNRHVKSTKLRSDVSWTAPKVSRKKTYAERTERKKELAEQNRSANNDIELFRGEILQVCASFAKKYGGTKEQWYTRIMQVKNTKNKSREQNLWMAYLSMRLRQMNRGNIFHHAPTISSSSFHACYRANGSLF